MKKSALILIFLFIAGTLSLKAESKSENKSFGLLFSLDKQDFSTDGGLGGGIGFIFGLGSSYRFRISTGFDYGSKIVEKPLNAEKDWLTRDYTIDFKPALKKYLMSSKDVYLYTGAYALFSYHNAMVDGEDFSGAEKVTSEYGAGGGLLLGAEWIALPSLSLSAEYSLPFATYWGNTKISSGGLNQESKSPSSFRTGLKNSEVCFILSFYF